MALLRSPGDGGSLQDGSGKRSFSVIMSEYGILFVFLLLILVLSIVTPNFLRSGNILNVLRQTSINGLLSIGMTFVILTGGIDLSVGSVLAFAGIVSASFASDAVGGQIYHPLIAMGVGLLAGAGLGAVNGIFVAKWRMPAFVVTLGMLSMARGFTFLTTDGMPVPRIDERFLVVGQGVFFRVPIPVWIFLGVFALSWMILYKTRYGRYIYAVGGNETSAKISGINTRLVIFTVYVISGMLSALGGIILTARTTAGLPQAGQAYELDAIAAVVIGGTSLSGGQGQIIGTLFGALLLGVINNGLDLLGVSSYFQLVVKGLIIIGAVLLDSLRKRD
jgi:ribose/xylose/arabinose/galactoside ABC-type transport system permease subunit